MNMMNIRTENVEDVFIDYNLINVVTNIFGFKFGSSAQRFNGVRKSSSCTLNLLAVSMHGGAFLRGKRLRHCIHVGGVQSTKVVRNDDRCIVTLCLSRSTSSEKLNFSLQGPECTVHSLVLFFIILKFTFKQRPSK